MFLKMDAILILKNSPFANFFFLIYFLKTTFNAFFKIYNIRLILYGIIS
jgi:hypothetical protein